jgi:hypothetical protein
MVEHVDWRKCYSWERDLRGILMHIHRNGLFEVEISFEVEIWYSGMKRIVSSNAW